MRKIFEYLRLILFMAGVLVGIQIPSFVDQYGKSLESHFLESQTNLEEFQDDANKYFDGNFEKLIEHYQNNEDPVFSAGGNSISTLYERKEMLGNALGLFGETVYSPYIQVIFNPIPEIKEEVWKNYTYSVMLNSSAIILGLVLGFLLAAISELLVFLAITIGRLLNNQLQPMHKARS